MRPFNNITRLFLLAYVVAALCSCSEYLDRRDTISLGAGNAVATDKVTQMVDPWPRASAHKNISFNGEKMQTAVERYRTNKVYPPSGTGTSASYQSNGSPNNSAPVGPTVTAAPVK